MKGWVYVISNKAMPDVIKVGFSTKDPKQRAVDLGTGSPYPYYVDYEALVDAPREIEKKAHAVLAFLREGKEWFRCDVSVAVRAVQQACAGQKVYFEALSENGESKPQPTQPSELEITPQKQTAGRKKSPVKNLKIDIKTVDTEDLKKRADQGDAEAQYELGVRYDSGSLVRKNLKEGFRYFLLAAEQGYSMAQLSVGKAYDKGRGIEKNFGLSLFFLKQAADTGIAEAQYLFGMMASIIDHAEYGLSVRLKKQFCDQKSGKQTYLQFIELAAKQGYAAAEDELGGHYETLGDLTKAFELYSVAASKGHAKAQRHLGSCYLNGVGCKPDKKLAKEWYTLAATGKDATAKKMIADWEWHSSF